MAKLCAAPARHANMTVLTGTVVSVVVIGGLYWAQAVLIPVALAVFLVFPLAPLVTVLQRWHLGRIVSVVIVVLCAGLLLAGVLWVVKIEFTSLARELPTYTENIQDKVKELRQMSSGVGIERLGKLAQDINGEWQKSDENLDGSTTETPDEALPAVSQISSPVEVPTKDPPPAPEAKPEIISQFPWMPAMGSLVTALGGLALALVLVVFMLLEREDLRNRLIRLSGNGRMTVTTKALDEAGERISRFLLTQLAVNSSYGVTWSLGLLLIGVDYALLWGFLAAVLRYVPYLGPPLAALLPIALSLAQFPGWWQPLAVIGLFLSLELVSNNIVEPLLYGQSIGVSAVAMIVAAAFWTFLWGPIGLLLSGPLTVCLVVLGKHVPHLEFFAVLLGDAPALDADVSFYQRLLARDQDEAARLVRAHAKASPREQVYDELLVPALVYTTRDREREVLTETDEQFIHQATLEVLEDLAELHSAAAIEAAEERSIGGARALPAKVHILACPARDHADTLALEMLRQLLNPAEWDMEVTVLETLTSELVAQVTTERSALICIGALPPGGLTHTRYLCKRLRARHPDLKIIVGRWGLKDDVELNREQLQEVGADLMATTLLETRKQLNDWLPVLVYEEEKAAAHPRPVAESA